MRNFLFLILAINERNERLNIPKYNGGLFSKDELLDNLIIDDSFLDMKAQKLSDYDFLRVHKSFIILGKSLS